jgi:two-component system, cell cycle sensor histidine kinase and response regulator CckA
VSNSSLRESIAPPTPAQDVDSKLLYTAYQQMPTILVMTLVATVVFVGLLWPYFSPVSAKEVWVAALLGAVLARLLLWLAFQRAAPEAKAQARWRHLFLAGAAASGAAWAIGPVLLLPQAGGHQMALLVGALLCVSAVAINAFVAQPAAMRTFVILAMLPPALEIWFMGGVVQRMVALVMVAGLVSVILVGTRSSRALRTMLEAQAGLRAAIAEVEATRARYFDLYDLAPAGYCTISEQGLIREANRMLATLLNRPQNMLVAQPLTRFIDKRDLHIYQSCRTRLVETGASQDCELRLARNDVAVVWAHLTVTIAPDADGAPAVRIALTDATERRKAEATRAAAIIDASMDAIISVDEFECIVVFSATAEKLFQIPAADAIGQSIDRFIPARFRASHRQHLREYMHGGRGKRMGGQFSRLCALRKDGTEFPIEASISLIASGDNQLFTVTLRDITERERAEAAHAELEAQLRESQKMEAIGTLAGGIAHDFNNILATILGNTELAREDVGTNVAAQQSLDEIRKAASRGRNLVQQILSFSRRQPTEHRLVGLAPVIDESVRLLRATLPARLSITTQCDADVPSVRADATQLEQVLINLATNAVQAMHGNPGHLHIRLDTLLLDAQSADAHPALRSLFATRPGLTVRLTVSDDGPGMDAATRERIFEPFFTTKAVNEGTGLGLSVVHGIVQSHGGVIEVDSQPGQGATFTIYLPVTAIAAVAPAADAGAHPAAASADGSQARHILYLDDDESLVLLVTRLMERRGYRISAYSDQQQALDAVRADPTAFDLVVTDYNMPGMSGLDVAREVRTMRADLPVVIASGFIDETLRANAAGAGVRELIFKASAVEDLCEAFARLAQTLVAPSAMGENG